MNAEATARPYLQRTIEALHDTINAKARAEQYREDLRDHALIAFYDQHIAKLRRMVAEFTAAAEGR